MKERKSYKGTLNGIFGIWTDTVPAEVEVQEEITFYTADEGKTFKKGDEMTDCVIIRDGVSIEDYEEVDAPKEEETREEEMPKKEDEEKKDEE